MTSKPTEKRKRGRPKTGRAMTQAEVQARYRARQAAKLAARTDDGCPNWNVPTIDEYFSNAATLEQVRATVSPEFRAEIAMEPEREEALLENGDFEAD